MSPIYLWHFTLTENPSCIKLICNLSPSQPSSAWRAPHPHRIVQTPQCGSWGTGSMGSRPHSTFTPGPSPALCSSHPQLLCPHRSFCLAWLSLSCPSELQIFKTSLSLDHLWHTCLSFLRHYWLPYLRTPHSACTSHTAFTWQYYLFRCLFSSWDWEVLEGGNPILLFLYPQHHTQALGYVRSSMFIELNGNGSKSGLKTTVPFVSPRNQYWFFSYNFAYNHFSLKSHCLHFSSGPSGLKSLWRPNSPNTSKLQGSICSRPLIPWGDIESQVVISDHFDPTCRGFGH